ncbi:hypothetical protein ACVR0A_07020 [Streptococcus downei]|uniref:Uncharacterized protein n=1 Tax=Streptococcus downei MFe28 TaxID=764290 RepID=A0A380JHZ9_STRDO|nr:hypothetical protein [Streptococcus downei]SUN37256.1 Uncharacterised protein [Streptococcus downei MFe28]
MTENTNSGASKYQTYLIMKNTASSLGFIALVLVLLIGATPRQSFIYSNLFSFLWTGLKVGGLQGGEWLVLIACGLLALTVILGQINLMRYVKIKGTDKVLQWLTSCLGIIASLLMGYCLLVGLVLVPGIFSLLLLILLAASLALAIVNLFVGMDFSFAPVTSSQSSTDSSLSQPAQSKQATDKSVAEEEENSPFF